MAITAVQSGDYNSNGSSVTSIIITTTAGVTSGNLLVVQVMAGNSGIVVTPPAGWSAGYSSAGAGGSDTIGVFCFYLLVTAATAGQSSWTFTLNSSHSCLGHLIEWNSGTGWQATQIDQSATNNSGGSVASSAMSSGATLALANPGELVVASLGYKGALQTLSGETAGWTQDINEASGTSNSHVCAHILPANQNAQSFAATLTTAAFWSGGISSFQAVVAAPPPAGGAVYRSFPHHRFGRVYP